MSGNLKVACSPLTNRIYAGNVSGDRWKGNKQDVTMDCIIATVEHVLKFDAPVEITKTNGDLEFVITVVDMRHSDKSQRDSFIEQFRKFKAYSQLVNIDDENAGYLFDALKTGEIKAP